VRQKFLSVVRSQSPQFTSYIGLHVENKTLVFYREVVAMALCLSVCLCLYSSQVVVRSKRPSESRWFWYGSFVRPILHRVMEKFGYPKIRVLPPGTLSQTQDLENFATASRSCCQQNASTVELTGRIYDGRRGAHTLVHVRRAYALTTLLEVDLLYNVFLQLYSS